jgi:hypothetical protein
VSQYFQQLPSYWANHEPFWMTCGLKTQDGGNQSSIWGALTGMSTGHDLHIATDSQKPKGLYHIFPEFMIAIRGIEIAPSTNDRRRTNGCGAGYYSDGSMQRPIA